MLLNYYTDERIVKRMRQCLLGKYMDELAQQFYNQGYARESAREYLRTAGHWSRYAVWSGITNVNQMTEAAAKEFLEVHLPNCSCERMNFGKYAGAVAGIRHILNFLTHKDLIEKMPESEPRSQFVSNILFHYDQYLNEIFGLCKKTRDIHGKKAFLFMQWLTEKQGILDFSKLCHKEIIEYQMACDVNGYSADWKKTLTSCLRGFLRFLRWKRIIDEDLTLAVYKIKEWKFASVPQYMPFDNVKLLLAAPDRNTITGKRDMAMLILMAYLGLRANEVINLHMHDIDFQRGQIIIRKTKTHKERTLPLTVEIAEILLDYIKHSRRKSPETELFTKTVAPYTPMIAPSSLGTMIKKYIMQIGIKTPTLGTHQLRHSLATHLINNGVTVKEIADILGHSSIQTTGIYAKVQVERLKDIALPFPCTSPERSLQS